MHQDFSFKHHEGKKKKALLATSLSNTVMFANSIAQFTPTAVAKLLAAAALEPPTGLRRQFKFTFGKIQTTATEISILYLK